MKKLKTFSMVSFAVVLLGGIAMTGCKKGDTGATGATGAAGAAGATGAPGPDSVLYSGWITLAMTGSYTAPDSDYFQTIDAAAITQSVLDQGLVLTYISYVDPTVGTVVYPTTDYMQVILTIGAINLDGFTTDYSGVSFRYVVIPGGISTSSSGSSPSIIGYTPKQLQTMSYANVAKLFGIAQNGAGTKKIGSN